MAKRKRPSGDDPAHDAVVTVEAATVPDVLPTIDAPPLSDDQIYVDLLDENGILIERVKIEASDKDCKLHYNRKVWRHVSDHADGTWQFAE